MPRVLKQLWIGWKDIAGYIGDFQARLLLTLFYFIVALPFGLLVRVASDPLHLHRPSVPSAWIKRQTQKANLPDARKQF